jgi:hypothetical protein
VCSPFAAETLSDPSGVVVVTSPDGSVPEAGVLDPLTSLPCIVVAVARGPGDRPPLADATEEEGVASVDDILRVVEDHPVAATALALCLRQAPSSLGAALVAESATYSLLQAGPEFARWRAARPIREGREGSGPAVKVERRGDLLTLTLNRPHVRNALDRALRDGLLEGLALAGADPPSPR